MSTSLRAASRRYEMMMLEALSGPREPLPEPQGVVVAVYTIENGNLVVRRPDDPKLSKVAK